jgi:hypothetical protein
MTFLIREIESNLICAFDSMGLSFSVAKRALALYNGAVETATRAFERN